MAGSWENDQILGAGGTSRIATLAEHTTRRTMPVCRPRDRTADRVAALLAVTMTALPELVKESIMRDQGNEVAGHGTVHRQVIVADDTSDDSPHAAAPARARISRRWLHRALAGTVCQHVSVACRASPWRGALPTTPSSPKATGC